MTNAAENAAAIARFFCGYPGREIHKAEALVRCDGIEALADCEHGHVWQLVKLGYLEKRK